jgi:hypothetical protein
MTPATPAVGLESLSHAVQQKNYLCAQINPEAPEKDKISALIARTNNDFLAISRTHGQLRRPQEGDRLR